MLVGVITVAPTVIHNPVSDAGPYTGGGLNEPPAQLGASQTKSLYTVVPCTSQN